MIEWPGWITDDPSLLVVVPDNPQCGRACLPLSEYAPLVERICELEAVNARLRDRLERISGLAAQT